MDPKTIELLTRLFMADAGAEPTPGSPLVSASNGWYVDTEVCQIVGELRAHLEATKQWDWDTHAAPVLEREAGEGYV